MLNSFPEVAGARELDSVPIPLKPKQSSNGQLDKDKQIASTCAELPLNITVNMNTPKLSNTNIKTVDKINFLFNVLISKRKITTKALIKKINPSCNNNTKGKKIIKKKIDNSLFLIELRRKMKIKKIIKSNISFLPIAPKLYIIKEIDSGDNIINKF